MSKSGSEIQSKFLLRNGADEVVYPEMDLAYKTAIRFNADNIFDFIKLGADYGVFEIKVPREWVGKDVVKANVRKEYGINVLAVKKSDSSVVLASGDYIFREDDHVIVADTLPASSLVALRGKVLSRLTPMPGVTVRDSLHPERITTTDERGNFTLTTSPDCLLVLTAPGGRRRLVYISKYTARRKQYIIFQW